MATLFEQNLIALAARYPEIAAKIAGLETPALRERCIQDTRPVLASIAPENNFTIPTLIVGLDDGRLEAELQGIPCHHPALPGFRPPVYLLIADLLHLAAVLHQRDWRNVLRDPRFFPFVGCDAAHQFQNALRQNPRLPFPKFALNVQPTILPPHTNLDALTAPIQQEFNHRCAALISRGSSQLTMRWDQRKSSPPRALKILGLTSRYTTFLQHSMRDWLSALRRLGHETRLLIEDADHELLNTLCHAQICADFEPDLILLIDHHRGEFPGLRKKIPAVMWIQDLLPNIFNSAAGAAQTPLDFCLGYGRLRCAAEFGYPESRFLPAAVGVNEHRFAIRKLSGPEQQQFECDVCYVGHTGPTAEQLVREQITKSPGAAKLLWDIYERLANIYAHAGFISDPLHIRQLVTQSLAALQLSMPPANFQTVADFFSHQVNYSFFRHQALEWLLGLDLKIHLHGRGWENHPTLSRYAQGVADNQKHLAAIYQAAKINLQITPHGVVHQRLFEGLCAGGFFLVRHRPGDVVERIHRQLWQFCCDNNIQTDAELKQRATPEARNILHQLQSCIGLDPFNRGFELLADLRLSADTGFAQSAGTLWPQQYDRIAFASQTELRDKIQYYLLHPQQRQSISEQMRQVVLERMTYTATSKRLLEFITQNLPPAENRIAA